MEILISLSHEFLSRVNNYYRFYGDVYCMGKSWFIKILKFLYFKGIDGLDEIFSSEDFLVYGIIIIIVMNTWVRLYNNWYRSSISVQSQEMLGSSPCNFGGGGYSTTYRYMHVHVQLLKWCIWIWLCMHTLIAHSLICWMKLIGKLIQLSKKCFTKPLDGVLLRGMSFTAECSNCHNVMGKSPDY